MSEEQLLRDATTLSAWQRHKFMVLVGATIVISLLLVVVALMLYRSSGAAQLDLSRPGYTSIQTKTVKEGNFKAFPSSGPIDQETVKSFGQLYDKKAKEITGVDGFSGSALSDESLSIDNPQSDQ